MAVVRRQAPEPLDDAQGDEAVLLHAAAQLAHGVHRTQQVDRRNAAEAIRVLGHGLGDEVVRDQRPRRPPPRGEEPQPDPARVHGLERLLDGELARNPAPRPTPQGVEHRMAQEVGGRMLHPDVDGSGFGQGRAPAEWGRDEGTPPPAASGCTRSDPGRLRDEWNPHRRTGPVV